LPKHEIKIKISKIDWFWRFPICRSEKQKIPNFLYLVAHP
jgi:hypothetical protein